jgi:glycosyltransferase involved in cell wall biosynthesis
MPSVAAPVLRVGFVVHVMQVAGAEMLVADTCRRLAGRIDPTVICLDRLGALGEQLRGEGVHVAVLDRKPGVDWSLVGRMRRVFSERRLQVVHAHQYTPFFYAALAKATSLRRPRLILTEHGRHYPDVVAPKRRWTNRLVLGHLADALTGVCQFSADGLVESDGFPARRLQVIRNGIDLAAYRVTADRRAACQAVGLDPAFRHVTCVARFHPVKDHLTLLDAFARVSAQAPDARLVLAGDGDLRGALEARSAALGIQGAVQFLGVRHDVPALLAASDVFVLSSLSEAASLTLLEAMACGVPPVVTDVGGNPEIVTDGVNGRLVPRQDAPALAAAIVALLQDVALATQLGTAARRHIEDHYRIEDTLGRYERLYRELAGA